MDQKIHLWLTKELGNLSYENPISIHLDQLLGEEIEKGSLLDISIKAFLMLVDQLGDKRSLAIPLLVIPLKVIGSQLVMETPRDLAMLVNHLDYEPPSLYLLHPDILKYPEYCEEYKCPLPFQFVQLSTHNVYTYYREFRCEEALKNQWEYSRCIYIQLNPVI